MRVPLIAALLLVGCSTTQTRASRAPKQEEDTAMKPAIVQAGAQVLRQRAQEVPRDQIASPEIQELIGRMTQAMRDAPGVGLAAPQLGAPWRIFVLEDREDLMAALSPAERAERERVPVPLRVLINPEVTPVGEEQRTFFEGCLSVEGYAALVPRFREVEVSGLNEQGQPVTWRVRGWPARILQHEMDHLNGALYVDRMHTRSFGTLPQVKERFGGRPIVEVLDAFGL